MCMAPPSYEYTFEDPGPSLGFRVHFSSLLLSADPFLTCTELLLLVLTYAASMVLPAEMVNSPGSMSLGELVLFLFTTSLFRRLYNTCLEAVYFTMPSNRTQPPKEHALKGKRADLCGRDQSQLDTLVWHDRMTYLSQFALTISLYCFLPGFFPAAKEQVAPFPERALRLLGHHYLLSFGMFNLHRACHLVPFLWRHVHCIHHWATHPLSRNTYQDHWFDNFGNAIVGEVAAQILLPIDNSSFWFSRLFRIAESLEKHAGVMGYSNIAHSMQRCFPFAQMPHHHDWHHEGHKSCNFTFSSIGGIWDVLYGTRKAGRAMRFPEHSTRRDQLKEEFNHKRGMFDQPLVLLAPVIGVIAAAALKLHANGYIVA
mmetsp:Transcript_35932/g.76718  ORF Transcript_35932/g.76718 Transcript_35932/m.76718 type:complete len:370 (-) Transcript_35932:538-1647(-)|eukprot:CAMPEP_0183352978 /NCGR_PEP_ID=MMETSP0164_2-20130417/31895_1 /TAXON_ID=221442 /ORGANISM="Coccolithus pelagicus ssp braarudi, Strain PLY182g" /LENGTH=369 /DNA_ID=CAMNT_0025525559 /DNA_START=83 /DNA_END=1192 /DNA_ORIENTATION=+